MDTFYYIILSIPLVYLFVAVFHGRRVRTSELMIIFFASAVTFYMIEPNLSFSSAPLAKGNIQTVDTVETSDCYNKYIAIGLANDSAKSLCGIQAINSGGTK